MMLMKFILSIIAIVALCVTAYFIFKLPIDSMQEAVMNTTSQRVNDIKSYEHERVNDIKSYEHAKYKILIDEVYNDKLTFYTIIVGVFISFLYFGFRALSIILKLDTNFLLYPDKYKIIPAEEANCIRYLKDKFIEAGVINDTEILEKHHVIKLLSKNNNR